MSLIVKLNELENREIKTGIVFILYHSVGWSGVFVMTIVIIVIEAESRAIAAAATSVRIIIAWLEHCLWHSIN